MSVQLAIAVGGAVAIVALVAAIIVARCYRRVDHRHALIVHRMQHEPSVTFTGALVLPIMHKAEVVDLAVKQIVIARRGRDGVFCADNIRADIEATFSLRVNRTIDDVLRVASTIGAQRAGDQRTLEELFVAKFSEAIKTVAKHLELAELYTKRDMFKDRVIEVIGRDLNGFVLDDVAIDYLEQTSVEHLDPNNVLDALGIRKIREQTQHAAADRARIVPAKQGRDGLASELARLGLLDVRVAVEVSCDVSPERPAITARIDPADDELLARLPRSVPASVLTTIGAGELQCAHGRATVRWSSGDVSDTQLVAGARLVHALREAGGAFR